MLKIAVIGGTQEKTFQKVGAKHGCKVLFHDGTGKQNGRKKSFRTIVKKADVVICIYGSCGHITMECVKESCKQLDKKLIFHKSRGASGVIQRCLEEFPSEQAA
ncbi:DUF2325 domain-containing protein [Halobacillus litoralis]|uniref:DUF2325 domain-containing protein n=1 Tax=Halobacillus litoralis TaxID=45668 RepID=A0A410MJ22_9BACI|nr:DUF2325 domain-containing protein [Halobacillus litoralis]QAS54729.1 DUF2325 domain-containing protein [Halobacillus litoralis]